MWKPCSLVVVLRTSGPCCSTGCMSALRLDTRETNSRPQVTNWYTFGFFRRHLQNKVCTYSLGSIRDLEPCWLNLQAQLTRKLCHSRNIVNRVGLNKISRRPSTICESLTGNTEKKMTSSTATVAMSSLAIMPQRYERITVQVTIPVSMKIRTNLEIWWSVLRIPVFSPSS